MILRSAVPSSNSAITARLSSLELDRLRAQLDLGVEPAEIEQVGGQPRQPARLRPRPLEQRARVVEIGVGAVQVLVEQLEHPLQRGQRRAQLVRGGRDERAASLLLLAQLALHQRERARQVPHLVARAVDLDLDARPLVGEPQRRLAQAAQPSHDPSGEREREDQRQHQPGERSREERRAHGVDRARDLVDRAAYDEHEALLDRNRSASVVVAVDRPERVLGLIGPERQRGIVVGVAQRSGRVAPEQRRAEAEPVGVGVAEQRDARAKLLGERCLALLDSGDDLRLVLEVGVMRRPRRRRQVREVEVLEADRLALEVALERGQRRMAQRVLQRPEQRQGGDGERRDRRDHDGADDPAAQTQRPTPRSRPGPEHQRHRARGTCFAGSTKPLSTGSRRP